MKTLYIECQMGAAGDMLMAALLELHPDQEGFLQRMNHLGIPGVALRMHRIEKCGLAGTHVAVSVYGENEESKDVVAPHLHTYEQSHEHYTHGEHRHDHVYDGKVACHHHRGLHEIEEIISLLPVPEKVQRDALAVYRLIAEAESKAHGKPVSEVHFHEVGAMDAVVDVVGVSLLLYELAPERVLASSVHVGSGRVHCAHGILPVPAPATAYILQGVPIYGGAVQGELCTPTGAALLKYFVEAFCPLPVMSVSRIGYGMGKKDFAAANCVRVLLGEAEGYGETVVELCCNLDDMTSEAVGFAVEQFFAGGALDVFVTSIQMKKNRPGILLTCMCHESRRDEMIELFFKHTTTLGVRESISGRYALRREERLVQTVYGPVRVKRASGWGVMKEKAEYEDLARIAKEEDLPFIVVAKKIEES